MSMLLSPPTRFSAEIHHLLMEAGWHVGRQVDHQLRCLVSPPPATWPLAVQNLLREFGGLSVYFIRRDHSIAHLHFDVSRAYGFVSSAEQIAGYAARAGQPTLYLVGVAYAEHLVLLMDAAGRVYGAFEEFLYRIAGSAEAAIEAICLDLPFYEIA